jgi:GAF domain-containing protein
MISDPDQTYRPDSDAADTFTELQKALLGTETLEQFLHELATLAARLVTDGVSCGMTMRGNGRPATAACSDPLAKQIDEVQYLLDDGPCLHAMRSGNQVRIDNTADRSRWPRFEAAAQARGIRSCLALPLVADGKPVGALSLYARGVAAFGATQVRRAENLAENASGGLSLMLRLASYSELTEQLRSSLTSRAVIYQALGVIMAQERCTQARAFEIMRTASQNSNLKLRDIAVAIVTSVSGEPPQPHPFEESGD